MMLNRRSAGLASAIAALVLASVGRAVAQSPSIGPNPFDPRPSYSSTAIVQAPSSINLVSNRYSCPVCVVFTEISRYPSSSQQAQNVNYGLFSADGSSQLSVDGSPASAQETLTGSFPNGSKKNDVLNLQFLVKVFPTSLPPPATYWITLRADLYASSYPPSGRIADTAFFTVTIGVAGFYDLSVEPTGGAFALDSTTATLAFGSLVANNSKGADILVKSNISYSLSLSSINGGAFANTTDGSKLPYSLTVNGSAITLPPGIRVLVATGAQASYGTPTRYALVATVLPYTAMPTQGAYSDTITVTLSAP
jgi:spore coat protein U-like protein